jgi:bla regulator protein blaR1
LEKPVTDGTGSKGRYEFTLSWMAAIPALPTPSAPAADTGPDLFAAVQQQLGLKLEASRAAVDMLTIDHFDRDPVEN